jgi:hypothetical protein
MNWQIFGRKTNGGCTSLSVACILSHGVKGRVKRLNVKQKQTQNAITMPTVILILKQVQHDENDWHSRSEKSKQVWYFARLFVPLPA